MLGINEHETLRNATFVDALLHVRRDLDKGPSGGDVEPEFLAVAFHSRLLWLIIKTGILRIRILG